MWLRLLLCGLGSPAVYRRTGYDTLTPVMRSIVVRRFIWSKRRWGMPVSRRAHIRMRGLGCRQGSIWRSEDGPLATPDIRSALRDRVHDC